MLDSWFEELRERGWATLARTSAGPRPADVLARLDATRITGRAIQATTVRSARPNTLSERYGLGEFPLHTDCADTDEPPRYVLLSSTLKRKAATLVMDARRLPGALSLGGQALFHVAERRRRHYARFLRERPAGQLVRYNAATHTPANEAAREVVAALARSAGAVERIDWTQDRAAIIDNWVCLHGREPVDCADQSRMRRLHIWSAP